MLNRKKAAFIVGASALMLPQVMLAKTAGTNTATSLNMRKTATTSAAIVGKVAAKENVEILDITGGNDPWYKINKSGTLGYVKGEYIKLSKADGTVTATSLNVRNYPSTQKSQVLGSLKNGTKVDILYKVNDFYKVWVNGNPGFVSSQYIDCKYDPYLPKQDIKSVGTIPAWKNNTSSSTGTGSVGTGSTGSTGSGNTESATKVTGKQIVETAKKYLGNPYVYGGTSLTNGTDCSGFTQSVMKLHSISIPRTSSDQSKFGTLISKDKLDLGDLLFFGTSANAISHCGIYIGDGKMIHASTAKTGIIISGAYSSGNLPLQVIRRVI